MIKKKINIVLDQTEQSVGLNELPAASFIDVFIKNSTAEFYINNVLIKTVVLSGGSNEYRLDGNVVSTDGGGSDVETFTYAFLQGSTPNPPFAAVRKQLDNRYTIATYQSATQPPSSTIYYKFYEDYDPANDPVTYKIYDWKKNVVGQGTVSNVLLGANFKTVSFLSPIIGDYYILEIKCNKGNLYYLRAVVNNSSSGG